MSKIVPDSVVVLNGNTSSKPEDKVKKQVNKAKNWCFVWNNYEEKSIQEILVPTFNEVCEKFIFEKEIGENGTKHLQGFIVLKDKARPSELKLAKEIHWEKCKGTEKENIMYCSKDYRKNITKDLFKSTNISVPRELKLIVPDRPYQLEIIDVIKGESNDRDIYWYWEDRGNVGKSALCKYLIHHYNACYITEGKKNDLLNIVYNHIEKNGDLECVLLDVPRSNENVSYKSLEEIKNGIICNTKYETGTKVINPPHIIVFANFMPDISKMSLDRWRIREIKEDFNVKVFVTGLIG